jgi:hypothetical protein
VKHPNILTSTTNKIFPSQCQYNRYSQILPQVVGIGVEVGDIGTNSAWKGATTHAASSCTISPTMAANINCAGWALGGLREKYIKYETAGDQFLDTTLCGLNPLSVSFSVSPPSLDLPTVGITELDKWIHATTRESRVINNNLFWGCRYGFEFLNYYQQVILTYCSLCLGTCMTV